MGRKIAVTAVALVASTVLFAFGYQLIVFDPKPSFEGSLGEVLPSEFRGWDVVDLDLAQSEEALSRVEGILNFTQAIQRTYRRGTQSFTVYVAYWAPRTMPVRMVQAHTPDICWVRNGWSLHHDASQHAVEWEVDGLPLKPAEYRELSAEGTPVTHVAYWHVVGDTIYTTRSRPGTWDRWDPVKSLFRFGLNQKMEQFFVRISSGRPLEELKDEPVFREVMLSLGGLAIGAETPTAG